MANPADGDGASETERTGSVPRSQSGTGQTPNRNGATSAAGAPAASAATRPAGAKAPASAGTQGAAKGGASTPAAGTSAAGTVSAVPTQSTPSTTIPATAGRVPTVAPVPVVPVRSSGLDGPDTSAMAAVPAAPQAPPRPAGVRRARLTLSRLDPWSVLKTAFMLSLSFAIILLVATALLWYVLDLLGVFDTLGKTVNDITGTGTTQFDLGAVVSFGRVMGIALVLAAFEIVLVSVLATMLAFLYNLTVGISGGLEVTLSEES